jgi:hypothetical protein
MSTEVVWDKPPTCAFPPTPGALVNVWTEAWTPFELGALMILRHNGWVFSKQASSNPPTEKLSDQHKPLDWDVIATHMLNLPILDPDLCPWAHRIGNRDYSAMACEFQYCCIFADRELEAHMRIVMAEWRDMLNRRFEEGAELTVGPREKAISGLEVIRLLFLAVFWEMKLDKILNRCSDTGDHKLEEKIKSEVDASSLGRFFEWPDKRAYVDYWMELYFAEEAAKRATYQSQPVEPYLSFNTTKLNESIESSLDDCFKVSTPFADLDNTPFPSSPAPNTLETPQDAQVLPPPSTMEVGFPKNMEFTFRPHPQSHSYSSSSFSEIGLPTPDPDTPTPQPQSQVQDENMEASSSSSYDSDFLSSSPPPIDYDAAEGMFFGDEIDEIMEMRF